MGVTIVATYKKISGRWTKWGGREYGPVISQNELIGFYNQDTWVCQSCASTVPTLISPVKFEYPEGEYIRVCPPCFVDGCIKLFKRLDEET